MTPRESCATSGSRVALALVTAAVGACAWGSGEPTPAPEPTPRIDPVAAELAPSPADAGAPVAGPPPSSAARPPELSDPGDCPEQADPGLGIAVSPRVPVAGRPLRILAATLDGEDPLAVAVEDPAGKPHEPDERRVRTGVPAATVVSLSPPAGKLRLRVGRAGKGLRCLEIRVRPRAARDEGARAVAGAWPVERAWGAAEEALYGAWVRELFHAERGEELAFAALEQVTSDPRRNLLFDHFAWGEDTATNPLRLRLRPDCADTPYFLRAYFAWKRRLPFSFRACNRGRGGKAPRCRDPIGNLDPVETGSGAAELAAVQLFFRRIMNTVHSGNGRPAFGDSESDFYPVELTRKALRPGTIYADPYGHVYVIVGFVPAEPGRPGILYAVDGQPDGSITRKRYWEGNFLWNPDPTLGGSGFKAFRPAFVVDEEDRRVVRTRDDRSISEDRSYGDFSSAQQGLDVLAFYETMDALITPGTHDSRMMLKETVTALAEAVRVRVTSIENADAHLRAHPGRIIDMPVGYEIFETTGPWEDFATPNRDLRLLVAFDAVLGWEARVGRAPERYGLRTDQVEEAKASLAAARQQWMSDATFAFSYPRSDGSRVSLTLAELATRLPALEVGYDPNDCPEIRWGAAGGSTEISTCSRKAPEAHRERRLAYRAWFHDRRRPSRGDPGPPLPGQAPR